MFFTSLTGNKAEYLQYMRDTLVPGKSLNVKVCTHQGFMEGHLAITNPSAMLQVTYAKPSTQLKEGDTIKATTAIRKIDWGQTIKSSGIAPGFNPIQYEAVSLRFSLQSPVSQIDTATEIKGYFVVDGIYPVKSSNNEFAFENASGTVKTSEVSFLLLPVPEGEFFLTQKARESNFTSLRALTMIIGLFFYMSVLIDPRSRKQAEQ